MQIEIWRGLLTGKAATNTQWTRELTFMDSASFAATVFARQFATVFNGSFQSFLIQLYNQLPMYVFNGLWSGRGEREPVLLFYGQPFPPFKAVFIHWNLHVLLCSEQRCTFCIVDVSKTKATSLQTCKSKHMGKGLQPGCCSLINALDLLWLNCHLKIGNASSMQAIHAQMACKCHNPSI